MTATCRYRWNMGSTRCALPEGHGPLPDGSEHANAQAVEMASLRADVARLQAARDEERRCRLANEGTMIQADAEIGRLRAEAASLRSALEGVAERRMIPGDGSYCFCFEFRGRHDDYCEEARAALRSPGTPSGRAE